MFRVTRRARRAAAAIAAATAVCAAVLQGACITAPPPDLPQEPQRRPTILHDSVVPSANVPLVEWPPDGQFTVPVELDDSSEAFCWVVFEDYNPYIGPSGIVRSKTCGPPPPSAVDGGVVEVSFTLFPSNLDLNFCHTIQFLVAIDFESDSHTPNSIGGDSVTWNYVPGGGPNCPEYDAGAFQDGAYPTDAPADTRPQTPPDSAGGL